VQYPTLTDAYFWAGLRATVNGRAETARDLFRRSVGINTELRFPYLVARSLAGLGGLPR